MIAIRKDLALKMARVFIALAATTTGTAKELALASAKSEVRRYWEIAQSATR